MKAKKASREYQSNQNTGYRTKTKTAYSGNNTIQSALLQL